MYSLSRGPVLPLLPLLLLLLLPFSLSIVYLESRVHVLADQDDHAMLETVNLARTLLKSRPAT